MTVDAWYYPHINRTVYKEAKKFLESSEYCTVDDLAKIAVEKFPKLDVDTLRQRIRRSIDSLVITGDATVEEKTSSKQARLKIITKILT